MRDSFIERLSHLAERDPRIMLITGDLGFGVFNDYQRRFPQQFLNVGIAEQNMIGVGTGLALEGRIVYTYSIANFAFMRCLEQIRNDASYHGAKVNVVAVGGGFSYGALGISHHATEDLAIMRSLPGLKVFSPCDDWEAAEATQAMSGLEGTCYLRLDRSSAGSTQLPGEVYEVGKARRLCEGSDLTIAVTGGIAEEALKAAASLAQVGVIVAEIGLGHWVPFLWYVALFHLIGHAFLRTLQFVRAPTFLQDTRLLENAIGERLPQPPGLLKFANPKTRAWLYRFALERGYLDAFLNDSIARPFARLFKFFDRMERRWANFLAGSATNATPPAMSPVKVGPHA